MAKFETLLLIILLWTMSASSWRYSRRVAQMSDFWKNRYSNRPTTTTSTPKASSDLENMRQLMDKAAVLRMRPKDTNRCQRENVILYYEPPPTRAYNSCKPILILTQGCSGTCSSYSSVDSRNPLHLVHSCSCCQHLSSRTYYATMPCERGGHIRIPVRSARECLCRPCYSSDSREVLRVKDYLTDKKSPFAF